MDLTTWLIIAAVMIVAEIITMGLTTIWFAGGALVAAFVSCFDAHWMTQLLIFAAVSFVLFVFTRPIAVKHLMKDREKTNAESLLEQTACVMQVIDNIKGTGMVKINGMEWTARSVDGSVIEVDEEVIVKNISGVKLMVEKK